VLEKLINKREKVMTITASEVKTKGVSIFDKMLKRFDEIIINVRGKDKYVVIDIDRYNEFRQNELDLAHLKVMQDIQDGKYKSQTASEHIKDLISEL
jgi:PHD/YefM family antitoxin component YafN of YafNO toxin-antitoxin module